MYPTRRSAFTVLAIAGSVLLHALLLGSWFTLHTTPAEVPAAREITVDVMVIDPSAAQPLAEPVMPEPVKPEPVKPEPVKPEPVTSEPDADSPKSPPKPVVNKPAMQQPTTAVPPPITPQSIMPPPAPVITQATHEADYLHNPRPEYPSISRRLGEEGRVLLRVQVAADGSPLVIEVKQSSGFPRLDDTARKTAARWRFVPAKRGQEAFVSWVDVPIQFRLQK
jgi:protein TonB